MIAWLAFYVVLSVTTLAAIYPMFRPSRLYIAAPEVVADVPVYTFDTRGFH